MRLPINWGIAANPLNWVVVTLMFLIGAIAFKIVGNKLNEKGLTDE